MCVELEGRGARRVASGWLAGGAVVGAGSTPVVAEVLSADKIPLCGRVAVTVSWWPPAAMWWSGL